MTIVQSAKPLSFRTVEGLRLGDKIKADTGETAGYG